MSERKPGNRLLDLFSPDLLSAPSREQMIEALRARAERFYREASLEETVAASQLVRALAEARGWLAQKGSSQIH